VYRYILILILTIGATGCTGLAKIKERHHRAPFEKEIDKGVYEITLYNLKYPREYDEKLAFYEKFDILMKKMLVYKSTANIMYSEELKKDLFELKKSALLPEELNFSKAASELSEENRNAIDKQVQVEVDKNIGTSQYYLNKQVYFWMKMDGSLDKFDNQAIYSELDKERIIIKVKEKRKKILEIMDQVEINSILKIENPYSKNDKRYWQEKDVYIKNQSYLAPELLKDTNYIYLKNVTDSDTRKIIGGEINFLSKIVIVENSLYKGYIVKNNKYIFFTGGLTPMNYYDGYEINIKIKNVELKDLLEIDDNLLLEDFIDPQNLKKRQAN